MAHLSGSATAPVACADTETLASILAAPRLEGTVDVGPAGTAMRFLTAVAAATPGTSCVLTGSERMQHRPIGPLVDALRTLGADISYEGESGFPPLRIAGRPLHGGRIAIDASVSSQFISALMMVTPLMEAPLEIELKGMVGSLPYIKMTAEMMRRRGVRVETEPLRIYVDNTPYRNADLNDAEPDWSAAAFWYEIAGRTDRVHRRRRRAVRHSRAIQQSRCRHVGHARCRTRIGCYGLYGWGSVPLQRCRSAS